MRPEDVPAELVEAAAEVMHSRLYWAERTTFAEAKATVAEALAAVLPEIQAQARRAVADEISSEAMSSDFLHDHVSDAGIAWFVREIREGAEEIDGRHVHTWAGADLECACGECAARLTATTGEPTDG